MRLSETHKIFALTESADVTTNGVDTKSVNMGLVHSCTWVLNFGTIAGDDTLKVWVGAATATKTTAIAFKYRHAAADTKSALSDTYGAATTVASTGLSLANATFDHKCLIIEFDADQIAVATPWVTLEIAGAASTQNVSIICVAQPRFSATDGLPSII